MASTLREVLRNMTSVPCIIAAIVLKPNGVIIEESISEKTDPGMLRAIAGDMLSQWEWVGSDMGMGRPHALLVESDSGPLSVMPVGRDRTLVAMGNRSCSIGRIRVEMQHAKGAIHEVEHLANGTFQNPRQIVAKIPSEARADPDEFVRAIERTAEERVVPGLAGEIVVIGVNTFRLARRLVATLSQAKSIRSSRLRAYSPGNITIDVVFEEGEALAAITSKSFDGFPVEVIEHTDTRLVLGISDRVASSAAMPGRGP